MRDISEARCIRIQSNVKNPKGRLKTSVTYPNARCIEGLLYTKKNSPYTGVKNLTEVTAQNTKNTRPGENRFLAFPFETIFPKKLLRNDLISTVDSY